MGSKLTNHKAVLNHKNKRGINEEIKMNENNKESVSIFK